MASQEPAVKQFLLRRFSKLFPDSEVYQSLSLEASGLDSLEFMDLIMEIEDIIGTSIPVSMIEDMDQTIGELIDKIVDLAEKP